MEVVVFMPHLNLPGKEHLLAVRIEEATQLLCCLSFPRVRRPLFKSRAG
jgi:hypothetical protein